MAETSATSESDRVWAIDWTSRRTWLRFVALTLYFSVALFVAVLGTSLIGSRTLGLLEPAWLNLAVYFVPVFVVWLGFLYLLQVLLKHRNYVADLDPLTMDRSLITPSRLIGPWWICISVTAVLSIAEAGRFLGIEWVLDDPWLVLMVFVLLILSETEVIWTLRKFLGEALPSERATREAAFWNRIGPISIVWNLVLSLALLFFLLLTLNR